MCPKLVLGIAILEKKRRNKDLPKLIDYLIKLYHIQVVIFSDETIINEPISKWPNCDALLCFYTPEHPVQKTKDYIKLNNPFLINDLELSETLENRSTIFHHLEKLNIPMPKFVTCSRDSENSETDNSGHNAILEEFGDRIIVNGVVLYKPFVEKPLETDKHDVVIYYKNGGSLVISRSKSGIQTKTSENSAVRRSGNYHYEEYLENGQEVKVYVGSDNYFHSEIRDITNVMKDANGKEIRETTVKPPDTLLTAEEKIFARDLQRGINQRMFGFDMVRSGGKSYIIDVNEFVIPKSDRENYIKDVALLLGKYLQENLPLEYTENWSGNENVDESKQLEI